MHIQRWREGSSTLEKQDNIRMATTINPSIVNETVNSTNEYFSGYNHIEQIVISFILVTIILGTIVGNILVCVAVCLVRKLRRPCNYLLVSLAVSDLCVAILVMPMAVFYEINGKWIFGEIMCNLWVSFDVLSCTASILNLCMISVDRYYAITKPLEYGVKRTPKRMILWVILVWCFAACISLPPLLILGNEHMEIGENGEKKFNVCLVSQDFGYQLYATMCSFYIPLTVMMLVYYKIFRAARRIVNEEKRAQSHLESHCYLEISVKNGGGPAENKISSQTASPAPGRGNHRTSSGSTNTMSSSTHGKAFEKDVQEELSGLQGQACLAICGAIRTTPSVVMEILLDLPPLHIFLENEARWTAYRLAHIANCRNQSNAEYNILLIDNESHSILGMTPDIMHPTVNYELPYTALFPSREIVSSGRGKYQEQIVVGLKIPTGSIAGVFSCIPRTEI